jgi:putative FmdB family regulatory protein
MAIYVWKCEKCETEHEIERKMADSDVPPEECSFCMSNVFKKIPQLSSFSLKGGGWYKDGYSGGSK